MTDASEAHIEIRTDASAHRIARVYAEALLDEAMARNAAQEILDELESLHRNVAGADPLLRAFFLGGIVSREKRAEAIKGAFAGRASELLVNFLMVLNAHDRIELLSPVREAYRELLEERTGRIPVEVTSAVPLADLYRERLVGQLRETLHREPILDLQVDPDVLGGLIVRVGDYLYDASVRTRLETMRTELIERSSHAIQTGRDRFSSAV